MGLFSGKTLSVLSAALILAAAAAAARIAATGTFPTAAGVPAGADAGDPSPAATHLALAREAEARGDVAEALSRYRKAADRNPGLVDRRSAEYLGPGFEKNLKTWVSALKERKVSAGPAALDDASSLFRRMYGGCG